MVEIVVWLKSDYSQSETIYVTFDCSESEVNKLVQERFGNNWCYYDINGKLYG